MFFLLIVMYSLSGLTFIFSSSAMQHTSPAFFIGLRMAIASFLILGYLIVRRSNLLIKRNDIPKIILLGATLIFIPLVNEGFALKYLLPIEVSLLWRLCPFVTAFFAWILFGERLTRLQLVGLIIGMLGFVPLIAREGFGDRAISSSPLSTAMANGALLVAVISIAFAWNLFKQLLQKGYKPLVLNGWAMLIGSILAFATSPFIEVWNFSLISNWPVIIGWALALALIGSIVYENLYGHMLRHYTTTFLSLASSIVPVFTAIFQWIILGYPINTTLLASMGIIACGLFLFYKEELRQKLASY